MGETAVEVTVPTKTSDDNNDDGVITESLANEIKHPLHNQWTLWYLDKDKDKDWEKALTQITTFSTVEDFWCLFNHIKLASEIRQGNDYYVFKQGIRPMWEDEKNCNGGKLVAILDKRRYNFDQIWMNLVLCIIGEAFDDSDLICGITANMRPRENKISMWIGISNDEKRIKATGYKLKELLNLQRNNVFFESHKETEKKGRGTPMYTL